MGIGALAIPGLGPFIAAGPIVAALAGAGAGGALGGITGALIGVGIPVSVHCDNSDWTGKAKDILKRTGADDVSSTGESGADYDKTDKPLPRAV